MISVDDYENGVRETLAPETLPAHPLADRFPMLPADELQRLAEDIRENGLQHPVIVDDQGRILDGRNRAAACRLIGVDPDVEAYEGDDPAAFVLSQNVARRHMTTGQQAMSTALVLSDAGKRENGRWAYGTAALGNSENLRNWQKHMQVAGAILDFAPDLAPRVVSGELALDAAAREAERRRESERQQLEEQQRMEAEEADRLAHLQDAGPEYAAKIGTEYRSARQAFAAWEDDNRREAARLRQERREAEAAAKAEWESNRDLYDDVASSLSSLARYADTDIDEFMQNYEPSMLTPNIQRRFNAEVMRAAAQAATAFATWKEQN